MEQRIIAWGLLAIDCIHLRPVGLWRCLTSIFQNPLWFIWPLFFISLQSWYIGANQSYQIQTSNPASLEPNPNPSPPPAFLYHKIIKFRPWQNIPPETSKMSVESYKSLQRLEDLTSWRLMLSVGTIRVAARFPTPQWQTPESPQSEASELHVMQGANVISRDGLTWRGRCWRLWITMKPPFISAK